MSLLEPEHLSVDGSGPLKHTAGPFPYEAEGLLHLGTKKGESFLRSDNSPICFEPSAFDPHETWGEEPPSQEALSPRTLRTVALDAASRQGSTME